MISVVIPLYNKEASIKRTIESVINQTYKNFEIIVINDGSTDGSLNVLKDIEDVRLKVVSKKNGGVSSARNYGIKNAKHDWIAFLDGDDQWHPDHLQILIEGKSQFPNHKVFTTSFSNHKHFDKIIKHKFEIVEDYFKRAIEKKIIHSSTCMIHKICFETVGIFNEKLSRGEDLEMWYRLAKKYQIVFTSSCTVWYRLEAENRAMSKPTSYDSSFASIINLRNADTFEEKRYLKSQIKAKYKSVLYGKEWNNLFKCFKQHKLSFL